MGDAKIRVTVKREYAEKLFYEKVLTDWKHSIPNPNHAHTVKKALDSVKKYPAAISGYTELKRLNGIGDGIAARLDATWTSFKEQLNGAEPRLQDVKNIKKGDTLPYLSAANPGTGSKRLPFADRELLEQMSGGVVGDKARAPAKSKEPAAKKRKIDAAAGPKSTTMDCGSLFSPQSTSNQQDTAESTSESVYLTYDPADYDKCELVLIVDGRELGLKRNQQTIADHLNKLNVKFETRPLSVGDYLWILKLPSGDELILDYVIERKTWDDLKASIRQSRYHEQKQRLKKSGIRNIILVAEGSEATDRGLEQALASTSVEFKFFIQRTQNLNGTARFLSSCTQRLKERALTEQFVGLSFISFQSESRKTKSITVSDLFVRQLTVIPLLSVDKAKIIVERFPTMRSLVEFYRYNRSLPYTQRKEPGMLMHETIHGVNKALSQQLALFFNA